MKFKHGIFILFFSINCFAHHPGNQIDADKPYPSINLTVIKDKIDGYNIFIDLKNFNLNPSEIADWILKDRLNVTLQLQLHKYIWGNARGK